MVYIGNKNESPPNYTYVTKNETIAHEQERTHIMSNKKPLSKYPVVERYIAQLVLSHEMLPYSSLLSNELSNQIQEFNKNNPAGQVLIVGATASGKRSLQLDIAKNINMAIDVDTFPDSASTKFSKLAGSTVYTLHGKSIEDISKSFSDSDVRLNKQKVLVILIKREKGQRIVSDYQILNLA